MKMISTQVAGRIKGQPRVMGKLMILHNKHWKTIERWLDLQDCRLATPPSLEVIKQELGLSEAEIFGVSEARA